MLNLENIWYFVGYVYMNGDAEKLSAGAVYPSSSESSMTNVVLEQHQQHQQHHIQQTHANNIILGPPPGKYAGLRSTLSAGATLEIPLDTVDMTTTMNGAISGSSSDGGAADAYAESNASGGDPNYPSVDGIALPLDQLKQMLSTQLEYYFSR